MNATLTKLNRLAADPGVIPDGALLDAFLAGDQGAFAALVNRHAGLVFATCRRVLRHRQDAEDAFQATFVVLARRAADVWPRDAVGSWLFGVAHRVALKARAVQNRRRAREHPLEEVAGAEPSAPDFDLADAVHRVVSKLPEVYRAAVVACDLQGLSRKEAAERLGWTEGTLSGRLARARELLATRLRRLGFSLPAGGVTFATSESVSAAVLRSAIDLVPGTTAGVSAPIAALTEGVVHSMALFKFKVMAAVVFAACALGYGAYAVFEFRADHDPAPWTQARSEAEPQNNSAAKSFASPARPLPDLEPLQGKWIVSFVVADRKSVFLDRNDVLERKDPAVLTFNGDTLRMPYKEIGARGWKHREYKVVVNASKEPKTIDLVRSDEPVGCGIYMFDGEGRLHLHVSTVGERPRNFGTELSVTVIGLKRPEAPPDEAKYAVEAAKYGVAAKLAAWSADAQAYREYTAARASAVVADGQLHNAQVKADSARRELAETEHKLTITQAQVTGSEKVVAKPRQPTPAPGDPVFTIHVRTLTAAEKIIAVKATGKETILDALDYTSNDLPLRADVVSVWVLRGKGIMSVDLGAIVYKGDARTNYTLQAGDQLFVQIDDTNEIFREHFKR